MPLSDTASPSSGSDEPAAPAPAKPAPVLSEAGKETAWWQVVLGFALLVGCLIAGEGIKRWLNLILPGNILGLFLLLALLGTRVVPLHWVVGAARWLLWLLPLLFIPIFVYALRNRDFWVVDHGLFAGVVAVGTLLLWAATGHLAQWSFRKEAASAQNGDPTVP